MKITTTHMERVETGPLQINEDWPGIFIRGDNAAYYAFLLEAFLDGKELGEINKATLKSLSKLLNSCVITHPEDIE